MKFIIHRSSARIPPYFSVAEVSSLEELLEMIKKEGYPFILSPSDGWNKNDFPGVDWEIEIYDDDRE